MAQKLTAARYQHCFREGVIAVQKEWHRYGKNRLRCGTDANGVEYTPAEQAAWMEGWRTFYDAAREAGVFPGPSGAAPWPEA